MPNYKSYSRRLLQRIGGEICAPFEIGRIKRRIPDFWGRNVFLLGSAPNPNLELFEENMLIVACNGSGANGKRLGLPSPAMTVVDFELLDPAIALTKPSRQVVVGSKLITDLNLGYLVAAQSNPSPGGDPSILKTTYREFFELHKPARRQIVHHVTRMRLLERDVRAGLLSTGGFALALSFFLGCKSAVIAGFSLFKDANMKVEPHFYSEADMKASPNLYTEEINAPSQQPTRETEFAKVDTRPHSLADSALITALRLNGHMVRTRELDFLPLVQNWGNVTPPWAL